ncbi:MAG: transglutaminaseTgpA domain-containing protein [Phycisphaerales bacterium]
MNQPLSASPPTSANPTSTPTSTGQASAAQSIHKTRLIKIYERSLLITMLGSISLFALADQSISIFIIGIVGALIGYWYASQGPSTISRIAINALLSIVVILGIVNALKGNFSVSTFAFFSVLLLILKLFDLRTPRDHGQILVLSLALIIASALTSSSMPVGVGVFLMGFIFIRALMLFRLYAITPLTTSAASTDPYDPKPIRQSFNKAASTDLRSIQTVTGFICVLVALLIFLIMPRSLGNNALGQWGAASAQLTTGFADDVELGRPGRLTNSPTPVLRLAIRDRDDQPVGSESSRAIYLRGSVLTQYSGGRWIAHHEQNIPTTFRTRIVAQDQSVPLVSDNSRANWTHEYTVTFDRDDQNYGYLFTPWKPLELRTLTQARVGIDQSTRMILLASQPVNAYRIRTIDPELLQLETIGESKRSPILTEGITPQIKELAEQILTRAGIDPDPNSRPQSIDNRAVRALETHLRTQFSYTLISEPVPEGQDATEWFLFERKQGHCEYYASALTLLARSIGVPARVVTGYVAAEYNEVTGTFTVRESNAHAWVEAMVTPDFWRTFDGTPQSDFHDIHEPEPTLFRSLAKFYEAIEHAWITAVVGYDSSSRSAVFGDIDQSFGLESAANTLQGRIATGPVQLFRRALITAGTIFAVTMITGLCLLAFFKLPVARTLKDQLDAILQRIRSVLTGAPPQPKSQRIAQQLAQLVHANLNAIGHPCPQGLPLKSHMQNLHMIESVDTVVLPNLNSATALLYEHHFAQPADVPSNHPPELGFVDQAQEHIQTLKASK